MLSQAVVLLALAALSRSAPLSSPGAEPPGLCSRIAHFQSSIREALRDLESVVIPASATIPVNTMEKGCIHSHLKTLLGFLTSLNSTIVKKLEKVKEWTREQMEFSQGSSEECKIAETMQSKFFMEKTSEFLKFLYQELSCPSGTIMPNP